MSDEVLSRLMALPPREALEHLRAVDARKSLLDFVRLTWHVLEPGRKFVEGRVLQVMCAHLEALARGQIRRLIINVPPGHMKSLLVNVFFPAWVWGPLNRPDRRFVSASYAESLSTRDNRKCRILLGSPVYQRYWGHCFKLTGDQNEKRKFENDRTGFKLSTSVSGVGTGERGDYFFVDDPHNVKEADSDPVRESTLQWITEVVTTRVNSGESAMCLIMQRVHDRDCSGHLLAAELGWEHLCLPMEYEPDHPHPSRTSLGFTDWRQPGEILWPELFPRERVEEEKKAMSSWGGTFAVAGQFQQRPVPRGGGMFKRDNFKFVDAPPTDRVSRVRGWDLAATDSARAPRTAGVLMSKDRSGRIFVENVVKIQGTDYQVEQLLLQKSRDDSGHPTVQDIPQDPGQAGKVQKSAIARLLEGHDVRFSPESGEKEDRARPLSAQVEAGNVYLVRGSWNEDYLREMALFPNGQFKDQVDASSRAYARLLARRVVGAGGAAQVVS